MLLKAALTKIKVARQIFILEIEQMREAWIPNELSTDGLPRSFWFYDDIMETIQNYVEPHTKEFAMLKN